jgi:hypothetical protein
MPFNFKLWLCECFIKINDWDSLEVIMEGLYEGRLDLTFHQGILKALIKAFHWFIDPLF